MENENYLTLALDKFVKHMRQERLAKRTIDMYVWVVQQLAKVDTRLYRLSNETIQNFILESESGSGQNIKINALKKFFEVNHPDKRIKVFIRPRRERKLIEVLTQTEVLKIIDSIEHPKQKAIVAGLYFHGFRLNELLNLKYQHIDREKNLIIVREGKGAKDRYVPLNEYWIETLKAFARFAGHNKGYEGYIFRPYSESSVRAILNRKAAELGIKKNVHPHLLRDCYATHLLNQGIDTRFIQEILGHENIKTTQKYLHISAVNISKIELKKIA